MRGSMTKEKRFSFLSADGKTTIDAVKWIPEDETYHAILQISHGMVEFIDRYKPFAEYLNQQGYLVVGHSHLGHGNSVQSKEDWGYFAEKDSAKVLIKDMHKLRTIIQKKNPNVPYFMLGHSMGSFLLRRYITVYPKHLSGAVIMGTGCIPDGISLTGKFLCSIMAKIFGWRYRSEFVNSLTFSGKPYKKFDMDGIDLKNNWLCRDENIVKHYYGKPECRFVFTLNGFHMLLDTVWYDNQMKNVKKTPSKLPILFVSGADDPVGDLGEGVKKAYQMFQKAGFTDVSCKLYKEDRHEILNELDKEIVYSDILKWMERRL